MENNVFEILKDTFKNQNSWNFYSGKNFKNFPLTSSKESEKFILEFFKLSGKSKPHFDNLVNKLGIRTQHVLSAFFLGHHIYQNTFLKTKIDNEITKLKTKLKITSEVNFSYMWFLICLFHDIGFNIESEITPKYTEANQLLKDTGNIPDICGIPKFYNCIYKNYFNYRLKVHCKNDHGITIAHIMYHDLCKIRELAETMPENEQENLKWEKDLDKIYAFCSWNVLAHNIWFAEKEISCDVNNYNKYKMKRLIFNGKYKIKPSKHPFFFLFCLVDTIEPYKKILDLKMLKKINLKLHDDKILIKSSLSCSCGKSVLRQASNLKKWLTYTKEKTENTVEISLNQKPL
ncbi:MAG: hypothetical protein JST62_14760 [Bacteroidetes bacterium]|nr:hypothetical protein [Bacteroidota bacterium]